MAIDVACPACSYAFRVPAEYAGRRGKCPKCHQVVSVPVTGEEDLPPASAPWPTANPSPSAPMPPSVNAPASTTGGTTLVSDTGSDTRTGMPRWALPASFLGGILFVLLVAGLNAVMQQPESPVAQKDTQTNTAPPAEERAPENRDQQAPPVAPAEEHLPEPRDRQAPPAEPAEEHAPEQRDQPAPAVEPVVEREPEPLPPPTLISSLQWGGGYILSPSDLVASPPAEERAPDDLVPVPESPFPPYVTLITQQTLADGTPADPLMESQHPHIPARDANQLASMPDLSMLPQVEYPTNKPTLNFTFAAEEIDEVLATCLLFDFTPEEPFEFNWMQRLAHYIMHVGDHLTYMRTPPSAFVKSVTEKMEATLRARHVLEALEATPERVEAANSFALRVLAGEDQLRQNVVFVYATVVPPDPEMVSALPGILMRMEGTDHEILVASFGNSLYNYEVGTRCLIMGIVHRVEVKSPNRYEGEIVGLPYIVSNCIIMKEE